MENNHTLTKSSHIFTIAYWKFQVEPLWAEKLA